MQFDDPLQFWSIFSAAMNENPQPQSQIEALLPSFKYLGIELGIAPVLDIHLGGMSGIALRRRLSVAGTTIPVVFITAFDDAATRAEAIATGCIDYLQKPFDASRLTQALERSRPS